MLALLRVSYAADAKYVTISLDLGSLITAPRFRGMISFRAGFAAFAATTAFSHWLELGLAFASPPKRVDHDSRLT